MFRLTRIASTVCALGLMASNAKAGMITICSDKQPIIDYPTSACGCDTLPSKLPIAIFNFNGQPQLNDITGMHFKFTMLNGDTGVGELDYNKLTLGIGNVDTGLKLNGFKAGQENSLEFEWSKADSSFVGSDKLGQILADLNADGKLTASIMDATPNDNYAQLYSIFDTQLCLTGNAKEPTPEPASVLVWTALAAGAMAFRRRHQSNPTTNA